MAPQIKRIDIITRLIGDEAFNRLKGSFRDLTKAASLTDHAVDSVRTQILETGAAIGQTDQSIKGMISALEGLAANAQHGGEAHALLVADIKNLKQVTAGATAEVEAQAKALIRNASASRQSEQSLRGHISSIESLSAQTRAGSSIQNLMTDALARLRGELGQLSAATAEQTRRQAMLRDAMDSRVPDTFAEQMRERRIAMNAMKVTSKEYAQSLAEIVESENKFNREMSAAGRTAAAIAENKQFISQPLQEQWGVDTSGMMAGGTTGKNRQPVDTISERQATVADLKSRLNNLEIGASSLDAMRRNIIDMNQKSVKGGFRISSTAQSVGEEYYRLRNERTDKELRLKQELVQAEKELKRAVTGTSEEMERQVRLEERAERLIKKKEAKAKYEGDKFRAPLPPPPTRLGEEVVGPTGRQRPMPQVALRSEGPALLGGAGSVADRRAYVNAQRQAFAQMLEPLARVFTSRPALPMAGQTTAPGTGLAMSGGAREYGLGKLADWSIRQEAVLGRKIAGAGAMTPAMPPIAVEAMPQAQAVQQLDARLVSLRNASKLTTNELIRQREEATKLRDALSPLDPLYQKIDRAQRKTINNASKELDRRNTSSLAGKAGYYGQGLGAIAAAGIFGGPEGAAGGLIGAGIGGAVGGAAGFATGAFIGSSAGTYLQMVRTATAEATDYAAQITKLEIALKNVAGSQSDYQAALSAASGVTRDFNVPALDSIQAMTKLSAAIKGAGGNVYDAQLVFRNVTAAIKATGGGAEEIAPSLLAMSQIFSKGKVSMEEINQLGERLPGTFTMFAKSIGMSGPEMMKGLSQGKIGLNDLMSFIKSLGPEFEATAMKIAGSQEDAGARLQVQVTEFKRLLGAELIPIGAEIQEKLIKAIKESGPSLIVLLKGIGTGVKFIVDNAGAIGSLLKFAAVIGSLNLAIPIFSKAIVSASLAIAKLSLAPATAGMSGFGRAMIVTSASAGTLAGRLSKLMPLMRAFIAFAAIDFVASNVMLAGKEQSESEQLKKRLKTGPAGIYSQSTKQQFEADRKVAIETGKSAEEELKRGGFTSRYRTNLLKDRLAWANAMKAAKIDFKGGALTDFSGGETTDGKAAAKEVETQKKLQDDIFELRIKTNKDLDEAYKKSVQDRAELEKKTIEDMVELRKNTAKEVKQYEREIGDERRSIEREIRDARLIIARQQRDAVLTEREIQLRAKGKSTAAVEVERQLNQVFDKYTDSKINAEDKALDKRIERQRKFEDFKVKVQESVGKIKEAYDKGGAKIQEEYARTTGKIIEQAGERFGQLLMEAATAAANRLIEAGNTVGAAMSGGGTGPAAQGAATGSASAYQRALMDTVAFAEGTYNPKGYQTMFGGGTFNNYTTHPRQLNRGGKYASDAAGRYQFKSTTWDPIARALGLTDFSPKNQDIAFLDQVKRLGVNSNAPLTAAGINKMAPVWASFPTAATGKSYHGQPSRSFGELQKFYNDRLAAYGGTPGAAAVGGYTAFSGNTGASTGPHLHLMGPSAANTIKEAMMIIKSLQAMNLEYIRLGNLNVDIKNVKDVNKLESLLIQEQRLHQTRSRAGTNPIDISIPVGTKLPFPIGKPWWDKGGGGWTANSLAGYGNKYLHLDPSVAKNIPFAGQMPQGAFTPGAYYPTPQYEPQKQIPSPSLAKLTGSTQAEVNALVKRHGDLGQSLAPVEQTNRQLRSLQEQNDIINDLVDKQKEYTSEIDNSVRSIQEKTDYEKRYLRLVTEGVSGAQAEIIIETEKQVSLENERLDMVKERINLEIKAWKELKLTDPANKASRDQYVGRLSGRILGIDERKNQNLLRVSEAIGPSLLSEQFKNLTDYQSKIDELTDSLGQYSEAKKAENRITALGVKISRADADAVLEQARRVDMLRKKYEDMQKVERVATSIGDSFGQAFSSVISGTQSAQQALSELFKRVSQTFLDMAAEIIASQMKMLAVKGITSILGALGRGAGGGLQLPVTGLDVAGDFTKMIGMEQLVNVAALPAFANGGTISMGRPSIVGENGPEIFVPDSRGTIIPNNRIISAAHYGNRASEPRSDGNYTITANVQSEVINNVEYVRVDQIPHIVKQAGEQGMMMTYRGMRSSTKTRKSLGMG
jgi:lysozyme